MTPLLAGSAVAIALHSSPADASAAPKPQVRTLPSGDRVQVGAGGTHLFPATGHSGAAVTSTVAGRVTVVPVEVMRGLGSADAYQVAGPKRGGLTTRYTMAPLRVSARNHDGGPAQTARVVVVNTDDPARLSWDGVMVGGESRLQVPTGHYSVAVAVVEADRAGAVVETDLLSTTDVTVPATGTAVALDARSAAPVSFTTPQPSAFAAAAVGWMRGAAGTNVTLNVAAVAGTKLYVGTAGRAKYGTLRYSVVGRHNATTEDASYLMAVAGADEIRADQTYPFTADRLATIDSTYVTDLPSQYLDIFDHWRPAAAKPADPALPSLPDVNVQAPGRGRQYVSTTADLVYASAMTPLPATGSLDGQLERRLRLSAGQHLDLTWRGGVIATAPATYDGACFVCRDGDTIYGIGAMDTDAAGDVGHWSDGPTRFIQDGEVIYEGNTLGAMFDRDVPPDLHRYEYTIDTTHEPTTTALSTRTQIAWGFLSTRTATPTPLPILYATTQFAADGHNSVAPGEASVDVAFTHQPGGVNTPVAGATVEVSYDDGATWQATAVTLPDEHHAHGTWTVPADVEPGYLAVRLTAVDTAGSTLEQTVTHAALVNAPNGLPLPDAPPASADQRAETAVCPSAAPGHVRCLATRAPDRPQLVPGTPNGLSRADLLAAYKLPRTGGAGRTIAVVDAHDAPTAEADLAEYRRQYDLPPCTTANGCFRKVNQDGQEAPLPPYDPDDDWTVEVALDLDAASAVCPACRLLLVESDDSGMTSMAAAVRTAVRSGATVVSNSWGGDETEETATLTSAFSYPGVAVTAASGDLGFRQPSWPAALSEVISVGGTTLARAGGTKRGWTESAWRKGGSSCSAYTPKPAWQDDKRCTMRTSADLAAVADPASGLAVYVQGRWTVVGGTSLSSPLIAAMIALKGNAPDLATPKYIYDHASSLFDVTSGGNAQWDCGGDYLCRAGKGYDAPTGMGTPNGLGAL